MTTGIRFDVSAPYEVEASDVVYARPDGMELLARVYRPKGTPAAPLIGLVDVHGGAWNRGDRTVGVHTGRGLAAAGMVVASLDFRQGPAHQHPAAVADISAGVRWMRAQAPHLGVDPARLGIGGQSSGGQLALYVALQPTDADDAVSFVLAQYPVADPLARYRYALSREHEPGFDAGRFIASHRAFFADEAAMAEASATRIVSTGTARALPPVWLGQPEIDDNVPADITEAFASAYAKAGGRLERVFFPGARHGFMQQPSPDTDKAIASMREFVGREIAR